LPNSKRGTVATIAVIALLVAVVGIGIANYYIDSSRVQIETTVSTTTVTGPPVTKIETDTRTTTNTVVNTMTAYSSTTLTTVSVSDKVVTPSTTVTIVQTSGNITQITSSEAVLYSGSSASSSASATASLLIGFYNPNSTTYITSVILESPNFAPLIAWDNSSAPSSQANLVTFSSMHLGNTITGGLTSVFTLYPSSTTADTILQGQTYQYVVFFASGVSVEGSLTAQ
jgi:hypothetical protein